MKTVNHRKPEASALRQLFQEQWKYFLDLIDQRDNRKQHYQQNSEKVSAAIESVVAGTDVRMRGIGSYKKRLRESVSTVLNYVENMVDGLSTAIDVNRKTFSDNPLVNAFFVNQNDLQNIFSRCKELHSFFQTTDHDQLDEVYALLFVNKTDKTVFGNELKEDMLVSDVMQVLINFSEHQILFPSATEQHVRKSLESLLFDNIVDYIKVHMTRLHHQQMQDSPQNKLTMDRSLKNPEIYLQSLIDYLNKPIEFLQQQDIMLKISKVGILVSDEYSGNANELYLNTVKIGDQPQRIIVLVRYPKNEMLPIKKIIDQALKY